MAVAEHAGYQLEEGYRLEKVVGLLNYPSNVEFSPEGDIFIAEAGFTYPFIYAPTRISRLRDGDRETVAEGFHGPLIGLHWHDGGLLATHRGTLTRVDLDGRKTDLVADLTSYGDHHTNHIVVKDGLVYFGQGTVTNSGVVGPDNLVEYGWLIGHRQGHDVPLYDVVLSGASFRSRDPFNPLRHVETGPFLPIGEPAKPGQLVKGEEKATGVIYRCNPDGSELTVFAWGLRNPYALALAPDGRLLTINQGEDNRGSRAFEDAPDALFEVREGAWYGWPDFSAGRPARDFQEGIETDNPKGFVLRDHPAAPEQPLHVFTPHAAAASLDFATEAFGFAGEAFVAEYGAGAPLTTGGKMISAGQKIVRLDMANMQERDFYISTGMTGGPRHPVQAKFAPDGRALYIVDHGYFGVPKSGALYRISPD
ncbi:MAG TPA: PQQ-dependent sugar dehydrogenase [Afifellaceae bacterium]|nr:PQQ-dependent sugar dehydrogenase [Afifellaceae bacterium]